MKIFYFLPILLLINTLLFSKEYHISVKGDNNNPGTLDKPFRNISQAAQIALPGDTITVHQGVYREKVVPLHGGDSDANRIVYRAAEGEKAEIKGSEIIKGWKVFNGEVWKVVIPNSFFNDYNPYRDLIHGDWFSDRGRNHHTGEVYLNGKSLYESASLENVLHPKALGNVRDKVGSTYTWYCESDDQNTYIYANFHGKNPNKETVEINVRNSCFYPHKPGVNYITINGFSLSQAATQWAPPTAEQIGLIGTHWSKGWIIENNVISDSKCAGISLGKDRASGQNVWSKNKCKDGATHYNEVIFRALKNGWSKENIGSHIVRNNTIFNCEQAGIVGSLGGVYSEIYNNHIYNIWTKRMFSGAEIAGIKLHAPIDVLIKNNRIHYTHKGIWLDWMTQGTRVSCNLIYDNTDVDIYIEVSHGPFMIDNNLLMSGNSLRNWSEGGAFVHNLINGYVEIYEVFSRFTPYHFSHSTRVAGLRNIRGGQSRYYNNIFADTYPEMHKEAKVRRGNLRRFAPGLAAYDSTGFQVLTSGNLYLNSAEPYKLETNSLILHSFNPRISLNDTGKNVYLMINYPDAAKMAGGRLVTTETLGKTKISELPFDNPDGSAMVIDRDYFGNIRDKKRPIPGPFEKTAINNKKMKVW
jgi:hypothetical protein